ncbi:MAG: helix-hairpin-helix domain-containing protein [Bacteroidales bacterium]|nr:helix-hairpin-helix domain-containing protein [Candidatus Physcousia equi]
MWQQEKKALIRLQLIIAVAISLALICFLLKRNKGDGNTVQTQALGGNKANAEVVRVSLSSPFDPNTADSVTLVGVGLSPQQARSLIHWRNKGKVFSRKEDFKSLNGLTVEQWEHIEPLITIDRRFQLLSDVEDVYDGASSTVHNYPPRQSRSTNRHTLNQDSAHDHNGAITSTSPFYRMPRTPKVKQGETIDLSVCDTAKLQMIPGIGSYYARRIAEYEERLGGYSSLDQLGDLDFLPPGIEQYMTLHHPNIRPLRINHLGVRELTHHPYISYAQAKAIANRVRVVGPFRSWDEILFLSDFNEDDQVRLSPYISFN